MEKGRRLNGTCQSRNGDSEDKLLDERGGRWRGDMILCNEADEAESRKDKKKKIREKERTQARESFLLTC